MNTVEIVKAIETGMGVFADSIVVTPHERYVRVWNCLCGGIMLAYNKKLECVAASLGMKVVRVRTFGDGRIDAADWEDRLIPVER